MRKIQTSKVNHLSRNGVIIVEDSDTALPNIDKNKRITRTNHKNTKNQIIHSIKTRKRIKIYQTKIYIVLTALVNHSQIIQVIQETNHPITPVIEVNHQNKEIHEISHKVDIVAQIAKTISIETTIHVQIQSEENIHLIPVPIQTLGKDTTQKIDHEIHHAIGIETIQIRGIEHIQTTEINVTKTIDQETIHTSNLTIKDTITITIIDHETTHEIGTIITIEGIILNPRIETIISSQLPSSQLPVSQHQYRSNTPKHQRQINQVQATKETTSDPPSIDNTESTELKLNHNNCESTDSESDTNNTISVNMLTVENDYEPIV